MMLTNFLIIQPSSPYYLSIKLEVLYRKMLKQPFPSNNQWNEMLIFKLISTNIFHEMIIQMDKEK
jgi:hypothetical protein